MVQRSGAESRGTATGSVIFVMLTLPHKHRVCTVLFSLSHVSRFVMRTSPHKLRVCAVLVPRFPLEFCTRVFLRASPRLI